MDTERNDNTIQPRGDQDTTANETTPLIQGAGVDGSGSEATAKGSGRLSRISNWSRRDVGYVLLFSIPVLLLIPALVFFVMTLNLRGSLPPSESLEIISNLTHRVSKLSSSLSTCTANSTRLATSLHEEEQRVEVCRESERRLAARVGVVEEMLDKCESDGVTLKDQLREVSGELSVCGEEKEELKRQMESGVFVQFLDLVGKMGTGGDSWVCSDSTPAWSHGYTTTDPPHPTIDIESWSADLDDVQHSAEPLVFPPTSESATKLQRKSKRSTKLDAILRSNGSSAQNSNLEGSIRIVGYTVMSQNTSGNNGWWRITKLPAFAAEGGTLEFFAQAAKWYGSAAKFKVTVYWISV